MILFFVIALGLYIAVAAIKAKWSYGTAVAVTLCALALLLFVGEVIGLNTLRKEPGEKPWLRWESKSWEMQFRRYQEPNSYVARGWR